MIICLSNMW